jgi:hypothetical protein
MNSSLYWNTKPCSPLKVNRRFGGSTPIFKLEVWIISFFERANVTSYIWNTLYRHIFWSKSHYSTRKLDKVYSSVEKCFRRPNATFLFFPSILWSLFYNKFRHHTVVLRLVTLTKLLRCRFNTHSARTTQQGAIATHDRKKHTIHTWQCDTLNQNSTRSDTNTWPKQTYHTQLAMRHTQPEQLNRERHQHMTETNIPYTVGNARCWQSTGTSILWF